ncbi:sensor histidine kinase [Lawsonibacter sp. OA9]|uniref:sensor histidine kinase n=1 Tax=Oscillospiraceae TaxID=216572 RepID=UPI001F057D24|nr:MULTISPECIES: sensor histidine kinase [Oscillospiraceae]MCH1978267.1 sensor histidine kinase [Lawsonibacter sp. OA9]MCH1982224.1 sensor histidine kinase [Ruminococcus sp. OA3]
MKIMKNLYTNFASIHIILKQSYRTILTVMLCPTLAILLAVVIMTSQYNQKIGNINSASIIQSQLESALNEELWYIVSEQKEGSAEEYADILTDVENMMENLYLSSHSDTEALRYVQAGQRALDTLQQYTDKLHLQIEQRVSATENEGLYREIKSVIGMVGTMMQQYIKEEIDMIALQNEHIRQVILIIAVFVGAVLLFMIGFSVAAYNNVMNGVIQPIRDMEEMTDRVRAGNLTARVEITQVEELSRLCESLNLMVQRISDLLEERVQAQRALRKSELRILQEQITPHFVYNTMETIIWLAEEGRNGDVIDITMAFTDFFRISLSRGREYVNVSEEVQHIEKYIEIQKVRYINFLTSDIIIDPGIMDCKILKLTLQPLVENAIYHGLKKRRGAGHISVTGVKTMTGNIVFVVEDNGVGMTPGKLTRIQRALREGAMSDEIGVGLFNVNQRLRLYYETEGLQIMSTCGAGTSVSFEIPQQRSEAAE